MWWIVEGRGSTTGNWIIGFSLNLGVCTIEEAKLWAPFHGLHLAWQRGIRNLQAEMDSKVLYDWLRDEAALDNKHMVLLRECRLLLHREWTVQHKHIFRESNLSC